MPNDLKAEALTPLGARQSSSVVLAYWRVASGFWQRPSRRLAWTWTCAVFALVATSLIVQIGINRWNHFFFDALQQNNGQALFEGVGIIIGLALAAAAAAVLLVHARMRLQVYWRQWLSNRLLMRWGTVNLSNVLT